MGQRLNIEIKKKDKTLANCYYHWSAYSNQSLMLIKYICRAYNSFTEKGKELGDLEKSVIALSITGAGIISEEVDYAKNILEEIVVRQAVDRNRGLISITEKGIENTRSWAEGTIKIDLENNTFDFDLYYNCSWYEEEYKDTDSYIEPKDLIELDIDFSNVPFEEKEIDKLIEITDNNYYFRIKGLEGVYGFIA